MSADAISRQVGDVDRRGSRALAAALERCLACLHRIAADRLDAGPRVRQAATVAIADVRDIAEATDPADLAVTLGVRLEGDRPHLTLVPDAPWPGEDAGAEHA